MASAKAHKAYHHKKGSDEHCQQHDGMDAVVDLLSHPGAKPLGNDHHRPGGQAGKDAHRQVDDGPGGSHGGQSYLARELAHYYGIHRVVQLLKEGAKPQGKEQGQDLFPDHSLGNVAHRLGQTHRVSLHDRNLAARGLGRRDDCTRFGMERQEGENEAAAK